MQTMPTDEKERRQRMFNMRLSNEEGARLDKIADHYGINAAELIRMLLKREENVLSAAPPAPPASSPKPKRGKRAA